MSDLFKDFIESLGIPKACSINQRLHKKQFYELSHLNRAGQEQFAKTVDTIIWTDTLKKSTINIPLLIDKMVEYIEVEFIHVKLKEKTSIQKIAEVIHRIPYPVVLFLTYKDELCISTALKRINQADTSKLTLEEYLSTEWIDLANPTKEALLFFQSLKISNLSFENFYRFYQDICDRIIAFEAALLGAGFSTDKSSHKKQNLDKIRLLNEEIASLRSIIKKETQFNAKVDFNIKIKKLLKQIDELKSAL